MNSTSKYLLITLVAALLFVPFLGQVHLFDWDEINFAECAREMMVSNDYLRMQIDFKPFYEKPPLFIWLQVISMKTFGINEFAARLPNALAGIATLLSLFYIGKKVKNEKLAMWWVIVYCITWLPHFYFKTGIIDPIFNLFIFLAFFQIYALKINAQKTLHILLSGLFIGLAVLTKGPVAILVSALSFGVYIIIHRGAKGYIWLHLFAIAIIALSVTAVWFGIEIAQNGTTFIKEFLSYQAGLFSQNIADHAEPWYYHPIVLLIGCFPASLLLFQYQVRRTINKDNSTEFSRWMWILFWVVLILFSIVKTKIVHYSSLCYFPISYLAALQIYRISEGKIVLKKMVQYLLLFVGILWGIILTALPLVGVYKSKIIPYIQDPFAVGNFQADVPWSLAECSFGIVYLLVMIVAIFYLQKHFKKALFVIAALQIFAIQITMLHFTPQIEAYSQRAAIDFYKSKKGQDVYVQVLGFRSYAYLFYTQKTASTNPKYYNEEWLLTGDVDKPTFLVCKIQNADQYRKLNTLNELYQKNGFVFFQRKPFEKQF